MAFSTHLARRGFSHSAIMANSIKTVSVVGSGLMGAGIAQVAAQTGHTVHLVDIDAAALESAGKRIELSMQRIAKKKFGDDTDAAKKFVLESTARLITSTDIISSVTNVDLVVEAIVENIDIKKKLFASLDEAAPEHTIFASNTSSFLISKIAEAVKRKDRFGGLHFFTPVPVRKLLEVIRTSETSQATFDAMSQWGTAIGKVTISCKDTPGFIVNRLLVPLALESVRMIERGDASDRDIDTAMKLGAGFPTGPIELFDYTGMDTCLYISEGWSRDYPDNPLFQTPALLKKFVGEGKLGMKSGEGFYKYNKYK